MANRCKARRGGFTLTELLVVVLIVGILAAVAVPQYFKVVERARVSEAHTFISQIKQAEERFLTRAGNYTGDPTQLDVSFAGAAPAFGMKYFTAAVGVANCANGDPGFTVTLTRGAGVPARYQDGAGAPYTVVYSRCTADITYPGCANCNTDF